jgi:uncharacterized protein
MKKKTLQKKQKALDYFTKKLLSSSVGKDITRIILFGSLARQEIDEDSDVDLMIFAKKAKKVGDLASNLSYDVLMEVGESIEPHVYSTSNYQAPQSYFVYHAIESGKDIYSYK